MTEDAAYPRDPPQWWVATAGCDLWYPEEFITLTPDKSPRHPVAAVIIGVSNRPGCYIVRRFVDARPGRRGHWTKRSEYNAVTARFSRGDDDE